jgi:hypothetical protein
VFVNLLQNSRRQIGFSGMRVRATCAGDALDVSMIRPSGRTIEDSEQLTVLVSDFLATGGDGILAPVMPSGGFAVSADAPLARDVFANYLERRGGRLSEEQLRDVANPRLALPGAQPVTCGIR